MKLSRNSSVGNSGVSRSRTFANCLMGCSALIAASLAADMVLAQEHTFDLKVVIGEPIVGDEDKTIIGVNNFFLLNDGGVIINGVLSVTPAASEFTNTAIFALNPAGQFNSIVKTTDTYLVDGGPRLEGISPFGTFNIQTGDMFVNRDTGLVTFEVFFGEISLTAAVGQAVTPILKDFFVPSLNPGIEPALVPSSEVTAINNAGQFLINVISSRNGPSPNFSVGGLFLGQTDGSFSTLVEIGDPATGIPGGVVFTALNRDGFFKDGSIFFSAQYGIFDTLVNGESFWRSTGGGLTLIAYEDMPTPGVAGGTLLDLKLAQPINGTDAIIFGNILPQGVTRNESFSLPQDSFINGLWIGSSPGDLTVLAMESPDYSASDLFNSSNPSDYIDGLPLLSTMTNLGGVTFLDFDAPLLGSEGTLYFTGLARIDDNIGQAGANRFAKGIWKWDPVSGDISLAIETSFFIGGQNNDAAQFDSVSLQAIDSTGGLVFGALGASSQSPEEELWYLSDEGALVNIASPGDIIDGMVVVKAEALHFNDNGLLATKILFEDFTGDGVDDQTYFAITLDVPLPNVGDHFTISDIGGEWHGRPWQEFDTADGVNFVPGTVGNTDVRVTIEDKDITLSNGAISLSSVNLTGSFDVGSPLDLAQDSSIENLSLNADLSIGGDLTLSGNNVWRGGAIGGAGQVIVADNADLEIDLLTATHVLETTLSVAGTVNQSIGTLNLNGGKIDIFGGDYVLADGGIITGTGPMAKLILQNVSSFTQKAPLGQSTLGGVIDVTIEADLATLTLNRNARLEINQPGTWNGTRIDPQPNSYLTFNAAQTFTTGITFIDSSVSVVLRPMVVFNDKISVTGDGLLVLRDSQFTFAGDIDVSQGSLLIDANINSTSTDAIWQDGVISGGVFNDAENIDFGLINKGELAMGVAIPTGGFRLNGVIDNQGLFTISHDLTLGDQARLSNRGSLEIESDVAIRAAAGATAFLNNTGLIEKPDAGDASIDVDLTQIGGDTTANEAIILVGDTLNNPSPSSLTLRNNNDFFGRNVWHVQPLATLVFDHPGKETTIHDRTLILDSGVVKFTAGDFIIKNNAQLVVAGNLILDGGTIMVENSGSFIVDMQGIFNWKKGTISHQSTRPLATISNFGEMAITGNGPHTLTNASIANAGQLIISGNITGTANSGIFGTEPGSIIILDRQNTPIDVGIRLSNTEELRVAFGTDATFSSSVDQFSSNILLGGTLRGGRWIVANQAKLTLTTTSGSSDLSTLRNDAFVELRGSGKFNNLTNVAGDLDVRDFAQLHLRDVNNFNVGAQFNIFRGGEVHLFNSKITVSDDFEMGSNFLDATGNPIVTRLVVDSSSRVTIGGQFEVLSVGIVTINGVLTAASLDIKNGGFFNGSGTINGNVINNGTGSPGNSPGILTINGDYTQGSTGVLEIELGGFVAGTEYDQLIVGGTATFEAGSSIEVTLLDLDGDGEVFIPKGRSSFDIILANDFILPTGADLANLVSVINAPNGLRVSLAPSGAGNGSGFQLLTVFGSTLLDLSRQFTPGQTMVAGALDGASTGTATDGLLDFALAIDDLGSVSAKQDALEQAGLSFAAPLFAMSRIGSDAAHDHLGRHFDSAIWSVTAASEPVVSYGIPNNLVAMSYGGDPQATSLNDANDVLGFAQNLASNGAGSSSLASGDGMSVFVAGSYEFGNYDATLNQTGFDYTGTAATIGMEYGNAAQGWTMGLAGSVSSLDGTIDLGRGTVDSTTYGISAYGLILMAQNMALDATVSYGWVNNDYQRVVTIPGQDFTAVGNVDGNYLTATARFAWAIEMGDGKIGPFGQIRYSRIRLDGFTETGGGDALLIIGGGVEKFTTGQIGLRGTLPMETASGLIIPRLSAAWNYVLNQSSPTLSALFVGGPDDSFTILTDDYDRSGLAIDAGLVIQTMGTVTFSVDYQGLLFNKDYREHSLIGRAKWVF